MHPRLRTRIALRLSIARGPLYAFLLAAALGLGGTARPVSAADVNLSTGSYSHAIPIEVPAFHGLAPRLAVTYSSGGGNGLVGVGWNLTGFSTIVRCSARQLMRCRVSA